MIMTKAERKLFMQLVQHRAWKRGEKVPVKGSDEFREAVRKTIENKHPTLKVTIEGSYIKTA